MIDAGPAAHFDVCVESTAAPRAFSAPSFAPTPADLICSRTASELAEAQALADAHRYADALQALADLDAEAAAGAPHLALRILHCEGWCLMQLGRLKEAEAVFERGRTLAESPGHGELDRAEAAFRLGACRLLRGQVSNAISLLSVAINLAQRGGGGGEATRIRAHEWRARCHVVQREWEAAQADAERAHELATALGDPRLLGLATMQCSVIAERRGAPLVALFYAERALGFAREAHDRRTEARLLNNIGGLQFLIGQTAEAVAQLKESFALSLDIGNDADAAQAVSSLAQVHLRSGAPSLAEEQARYALSILDDRDDYVDERGNAHLVLGRALLDQGRHSEALAEFATAEELYERLGSASHVAAAWVANADALRAGGDVDAAADLYRRAADALQDVHF